MKLDLKELLKADSMEFEDGVLHAALTYAKAGIYVLPVEMKEKKLPLNSDINYGSATTSTAKIREWFGEKGLFRGYNLGIGCGMEGGVFALDVDSKPKGGTTGLEQIGKLVSKNGALPLGPVQKTPSGGLHYLYEWRQEALSSTNKIANGIDTRGGTQDRVTGHIVAYPSRTSTGRYEWIAGGELTEPPSWIISALGESWAMKTKPSSKPEAVQEMEETKEVPHEQVMRMMSYIDPDNLTYEEWVQIGMALKTVMSDDGYDIWDSWSEKGIRRKKDECGFRWRGFNDEGKIGFGTLKYFATQGGWVPLAGDVLSTNTDSRIEEAIIRMNKDYAIIRLGKAFLVATFTKNPKGESIGFLNMSAFKESAVTETIQVPSGKGTAIKKLSDIWVAHENRREYYDMGIYPNNDNPSDTLNTFAGWGCEAKEGDCSLYLEHMKNIICGGNIKLYDWLLDWMADIVQDARNVKGSCVVLRGIEGCGKGAWADTFGKLFGKHYTHVIDSERLTSKFNNHLADAIFVFADEVLYPGDRKTGNILKGMVTERTMVRESKGVDATETDNLMRIAIASNENWIVPAGPQSRRWLVLECLPDVANNVGYFKPLFEQMDNGGREALMYLLRNRVITSNLREAPETEALFEQRLHSSRHDPLTDFLYEATIRKSFLTPDINQMVGEDSKWQYEVLKAGLYDEYKDWTKDRAVSKWDVLPMATFLHTIKQHGFKEIEDFLIVPSRDALTHIINIRRGQVRKDEQK